MDASLNPGLPFPIFLPLPVLCPFNENTEYVEYCGKTSAPLTKGTNLFLGTRFQSDSCSGRVFQRLPDVFYVCPFVALIKRNTVNARAFGCVQGAAANPSVTPGAIHYTAEEGSGRFAFSLRSKIMANEPVILNVYDMVRSSPWCFITLRIMFSWFSLTLHLI